MREHVDAPLTVRVFHFGVSATRWLLLAVAPLLVVLSVLVIFGIGSVSLPGSTEEVRPVQLAPGEYQIERNGEIVDVAETTSFESEDGDVTFGTTRVSIAIAKQHRALRLVSTIMVLGWWTLAWVAVSNLAALAGSIRSGEGFVKPNTHRLRRIGAAVLAYPMLTFLVGTALRQLAGSLDLDGPSVTVDIGPADWWAWLLFGLLLLAVTELFAHGVKLQEFDEATV